MESAANNRQPWTKKEDEILCTLTKKHGVGNWTIISEKMSARANTGGRSGKQCRQRWHNHLDPEISKKDWTTQEERVMFQEHKMHGNKWANISAKLQGRTDNDIKNHFYSTLRKSLRRINKILGLKNSTQKIKQIKPCVLSKLFDAKSEIPASKEVSEALFKFSLENKSYEDMQNCSQSDKALYQRMIESLNQISDQQKEVKIAEGKGKNSIQNRAQRSSRLRDKQIDSDVMKQESPEKQQHLNKEKGKSQIRKTKPIVKKQRVPNSGKKQTKTKNKGKNRSSQEGQQNHKDPSIVDMPQFNLSMKSHSNKAGQTSMKEEFGGSQSMIPQRYVSKRSSSGRPESSIPSFERSLRSHRDSGSNKDQSFLEFNLNDLMLKKKSSSFNELKKIMSPLDRRTFYVTPRNPSPAFGSVLFENFRVPDKETLEQDIDQSKEKIRRQIAKNCQT